MIPVIQWQTIEMAKSDEEYDVELCSTPPSHADLELELTGNDPQSIYSWKVVKNRRPRRRNTVSHGGSCSATTGAVCIFSAGSNAPPPAPPSTPTSLTPTNTSLSSALLNPNACVDEYLNGNDLAQRRLDGLLYIFDFKHKKKLKEQQRAYFSNFAVYLLNAKCF